jgi:phage-related protein
MPGAPPWHPEYFSFRALCAKVGTGFAQEQCDHSRLEHCAQKWVSVLRNNNATTQDLRAFLLASSGVRVFSARA